MFLIDRMDSSSRATPSSVEKRPLDDLSEDIACDLTRLKEDFGRIVRTQGYGDSDYSPELSGLPSEGNSEVLRAAGWLTQDYSERLGSNRGYLDPLGEALLRKCFRDHLGSENSELIRRKGSSRHDRFSFQGLLNRISSRNTAWERATERIRKSREETFFVKLDGKTEQLTFVLAMAPEGNRPSHIQGLRLTGSGKPRTPAGLIFKRDVSEILADQIRRDELAAERSRTKPSTEVSPTIQKLIIWKLQDAGIEFGSYSLAAFGAEIFPTLKTEVAIDGSLAVLNFERCADCRTVRAISISNGTPEQKAACDFLNFNEIGPWHRKVCPTVVRSMARLKYESRLSAQKDLMLYRRTWPQSAKEPLSSRSKLKTRSYGNPYEKSFRNY